MDEPVAGDTLPHGRQILEAIEQGSDPLRFGDLVGTKLRAEIGEETFAIAERINAAAWEARRRESLARILSDISTDLATLHDLNSILRAIVRRTRSLLGADLAYLSLNDYDSGETYIRMTDGAISESFQHIRMPIGTGVLGKVAAGSAPAQTTDYLTDRAFAHFEQIDQAVQSEGVQSILGAPLRVGEQVIGALLVANRYSHQFSADDSALMMSLAANAAVVLQSGRLLEDAAKSLADLEAMQRVSTRTLEELENLTRLDRALIELLAEGASADAMERTLADVFAADVLVVDPIGVPRAGGLADVEGGDLLEALAAAAATHHPVETTIGGRPATIAPLTGGGRQLGGILVRRMLTPALQRALEHASSAVSVALLIERSRTEADARAKSELLDDLLRAGRDVDTALRRRAAAVHLTGGTSLTVHVIAVPEAALSRTHAVSRLLKTQRGTLVGVQDGRLCVVESTQPGAGPALRERLFENRITATIGSSEPFDDLAELQAAHGEASDVVDALIVLGRTGDAATPADLGTAGMLIGRRDTTYLTTFVDNILGALIRYDQQRETELERTAWVFLESGQVLAPAAAALHIHVNTLRQRLGRISELLGASWRSGGHGLDVLVALRARALTGPSLEPNMNPSSQHSPHLSPRTTRRTTREHR